MGMYQADFGVLRPTYVGIPNIALDGFFLQFEAPESDRDPGAVAVCFGMLDGVLERMLADPEFRRFRPNTQPTATAYQLQAVSSAKPPASAAAPVAATSSSSSALDAADATSIPPLRQSLARQQPVLYAVSTVVFAVGALLALKLFSRSGPK
jgi:hypothetical protein